MSKNRYCMAVIAASFALSMVPAQDRVAFGGAVPKANPPGTVVIEHDGDRIVVQMGGGKPKVTINGETVTTKKTRRLPGVTGEADGYRVKLTPLPTAFGVGVGGGGSLRPHFDYTRFPTRLPGALGGAVGSGAVGGGVEAGQPAASSRPYIGVQVGSVPSALCDHLELDAKKCVLILKTTKGGPAANAGLSKNDILVGIDDEKAVTDTSLRAAVAKKKKGDTMVLHVLRRGKDRFLEVEVGERAVSLPTYWGAVDPKMLNGYWHLDATRNATAYGALLPAFGYETGMPDVRGGKASSDALQKQLKKIELQVDKLQKQLEKLNR